MSAWARKPYKNIINAFPNVNELNTMFAVASTSYRVVQSYVHLVYISKTEDENQFACSIINLLFQGM